MSRYTIHTGDCREVLRDYPDNHFDSIVTDPPYGLTLTQTTRASRKHAANTQRRKRAINL